MNWDHFWLTDDQFSKIEPHLPTDTRGKARVDDRRVISGIINVLKSGGRWIDAPPEYGPRKTLYNRYVRWAAKGVWVDLFHALAQTGGPPEQVLKCPKLDHERSIPGQKNSKNRLGSFPVDFRSAFPPYWPLSSTNVACRVKLWNTNRLEIESIRVSFAKPEERFIPTRKPLRCVQSEVYSPDYSIP